MGRGACSLLAALVACAALAPVTAHAQAGGAAAACPASFEVLHDDSVGPLRFPKGPYTLTVLDPSTLSCTEASDLFRQFLEDFDGVLPRPWVASAATRTFSRGPAGSVGFSWAPSSAHGGGGGGHHPQGTACPGTFQVLHNDRIGRLAVPKGSYGITLLAAGRLTCAKASSYFTRFLQDFDGVLPRPWFIDTETGSFMRGSRNVGFRIKELVGPPSPSGGGSGTHPTGDRCPGTFRVLNDDRIGKLRLRRGPYRITLLGSRLSCQAASRLFRGFLDDFDGVLARPWVVNRRTGTFTRGRGGKTGFRVKAARAAGR
jgi:hypothetical protein